MSLWTPSVAIAGVAIDDRVLDLVTIRQGRRNSRETTNASTCTIGLVWKTDAPVYDVDLLRLGARVTVTAEVAGPSPAVVTRFDGAITDVTVGRNTAQIVATTNILARLGRTVADLPATSGPLPDVAATWWASIQLQHPDLGFAFTAPTAEPEDVDVDMAARSNVRALDALRELTDNDPAAFWYETVDAAELRLSTGATRLPDELAQTLLVPVESVLDQVRLERTVNGRTNEVAVEWTGGTETLASIQSVARFGPYGQRIETRIDNAGDAELVAARIIAAGASDGWNLESIPVEVGELAPFSTIDTWLDTLRINRLVQLPTLPAGLPELPGRVWVEGWDETLSRSRWTLTLHITDPRSVGWPQRWFEVPPSIRWDDLAGPTWDDVVEAWDGIVDYQTWSNYSPRWEDLLTEWITA